MFFFQWHVCKTPPVNYIWHSNNLSLSSHCRNLEPLQFLKHFCFKNWRLSVCFISLLWLATLFMWTKQTARSIDRTRTTLLLFQQHCLCFSICFSNQQFRSCCITSLVLLWSASLACINPKLFPTVNTQECTAPIGYYCWCECEQKSPWSLGSSWYCSLLLLLVLMKT